MKKLISNNLFKGTLILLILAAAPIFAIASAKQSSSTAGKPLTQQQQAVRAGNEAIQAKLQSGAYDNLAEVISDDVKLHEQNGFKFGGVSFSITDAKTVKEYYYSKDILHETVYNKDSNNNLTKVSDQTFGSFNSANNTKFSSLTQGLINKLTQIKMHKKSLAVNTGVALADQGTTYDGYQSSDYLSMWQSMYYFGDGYHDVDISTHNNWTGNDCGEADPGPRDGMDVEWNPNNLYMGSVVWQPNTYTSAGPFGWNGVHDIAIDQSTEYYGVNGGYYVEPDHCCKTNYVEVYLYPVSSSVYGQTSNYYGNYIHSWNWVGGGTIDFSIGYGAFSISYSSAGTGSYKINNWGTYTI